MDALTKTKMDKPVSKHPDHELLLRFFKGERAAVEQIQSRVYPVIKRMVFANSGNDEDAYDTCSQGILVIFNTYGNNENFVLTTKVEGIFYGVCKKIWMKELEKRRRLQITFRDLPEYMNWKWPWHMREEDDDLDEYHQSLIAKYLSRLSKKDRRIIEAYYWEKKSHDDIAKEIDYKNGDSVKVRKSNILARIRNWWLRENGNES
jgi:RNA polymerase sigma factor (sigma-70 family)